MLYLLSKHEEHLADHRIIPLSNQAERDFFQDQEQYEQWLAEAEKHIDRWVAEDESLVIKRNDVHSLRHRLNMEAERVERELLDGDEEVESEEENELDALEEQIKELELYMRGKGIQFKSVLYSHPYEDYDPRSNPEATH